MTNTYLELGNESCTTKVVSEAPCTVALSVEMYAGDIRYLNIRHALFLLRSDLKTLP